MAAIDAAIFIIRLRSMNGIIENLVFLEVHSFSLLNVY